MTPSNELAAQSVIYVKEIMRLESVNKDMLEALRGLTNGIGFTGKVAVLVALNMRELHRQACAAIAKAEGKEQARDKEKQT